MKHILLTSIMFILFGTTQSCKKQDTNINNATDFEKYLEDEMDAQHLPALSVLIFKEDNILYEKQLGQSNIQQNLTLADNHLFLLASVSKVVTATALLQLYEDGAFGLDDKINDYLPFTVNVPNTSTDITFRMLLTHTSGIADGSALDDQYYNNEDSPVALASFMEDYLAVGGAFYNANENFHDFEPGTAHKYSNAGSALIGVLVEEISGMGFNEYCKQNIFSPLGMSNTFWRLDEISQTKTIVTPYNYVRRDYESIPHYTFTDYPNGGLRSTAKDMFKLLQAFILDGQSNNHQLLESNTINTMLTPQIPAIDEEVGLHLFVMNADDELWGHDGGEKGVATIMAFNRNTKVGAIILCNQGEADLDEMLVEAYQLGLKL